MTIFISDKGPGGGDGMFFHQAVGIREGEAAAFTPKVCLLSPHCSEAQVGSR